MSNYSVSQIERRLRKVAWLVDAYGEANYWATFERLEKELSKKTSNHDRIAKYINNTS